MSREESAQQRLLAYLQETRLLGSIHSTLYYDQNTVMPAAGAEWRGEQLALLARQLHARQSSPHYADLLAAAEAATDSAASPAFQHNLRLLRLELQRQQCLDPDLVSHLARAQARGNALWQEARKANSFSLFAPALEELLCLRRAQARQQAPVERCRDGEDRSAWEVLAQRFEPDISKRRLRQLFTPLKQRLPALMARVAGTAAATGTISTEQIELPEAEQERLCSRLLDQWGFDPTRCQRSRSAHPFSCTLGPQDFRITTRVVPGQLFSAFLATAHEWGHSLYEQGLPRSGDHYFPWPLGEATSMGVHESQSLFWECRIARGRAFAQRWYPRFREALGSDPWGTAHGFWQAINPMRAGLIRVEADELSYCLHIVLRFELELALVEEELPVADLPGEWNRAMEQLLGLCPSTDAEGCLQDIHWAEGLFGYFPSYALGHLISAQLSESMEEAIGAIDTRVAQAEEACIRRWLATHVWPLGRSVNGEELVEQVTGRPLSPEPFLTYLEGKLNRRLAPA